MYASNISIERLVSELTDMRSSLLSDYAVNVTEGILFSGIEDSYEKGDVILVFGSPDCLRFRATKAFECYAMGRAGKAVLSGGVTVPQTGLSEAQSMWKLFTEFGAYNTDLFIETASKFTHENVMFSSDIIRALFEGKPVKILAVTSYEHMRRVLLNFQHYTNLFPAGTQFLPVPSASTKDCEPYLWRSTPGGRAAAAKEITNIITYIRKGYLPDFELKGM